MGSDYPLMPVTLRKEELEVLLRAASDGPETIDKQTLSRVTRAGWGAVREQNRRGDLYPPNPVVWNMLRRTERDRSIRGDVDTPGSSEPSRVWDTARETRAASYRQGYLDALRDAHDAIQHGEDRSDSV